MDVKNQLRRYNTTRLPVKNHSTHLPENLSKKIVDTLVNYVKTQVLLIVLVTVSSWLLLTFLGIRYAPLLAFITGSLSIIPVLGITTAAIIVAIVAIFDGVRFLPNFPEFIEGIAVLTMYGLVNISIDYFLSPYLTGKITKIHPVLLLLAVIVGTAVFGILGALFAVPVVLVVKVIIDHNTNPNIESKRLRN